MASMVLTVLRRSIAGQCSKFARAGSGHMFLGGRRKSSTMFSTLPEYTMTKNSSKGCIQKDKDQKLFNDSNNSKDQPETYNLVPVTDSLNSRDDEYKDGYV